MQDNFWEDITDQLCETIAGKPVNCDTDWLGPALDESKRGGLPIQEKLTLGQVVENKEYVKRFGVGSALEIHSQATEFTEDLDKDVSVSPLAEAGLNILNLISRSTQGPEGRQHVTGDGEAFTEYRFTPTSQRKRMPPTSGTVTTGMAPDAPTSRIWEYLSDSSPTPAVVITHEASGDVSSPTTPTINTNVKSLKRKLSFGMPVLGGGDQVKVPPPKLRRASPTIEDQTFSQYINADAVASPNGEVAFKDIPGPSTKDIPNDKETPKTPVPVEFSLPSSPEIIKDDNNESYPRCYDGLGVKIPLHHLKSLRKAVDPTFQNHEYWGDSLYFSEEPVYSNYCDRSEAYGLHSWDWRIIFHALDNDAEDRIPLADTSTKPRMSDEQLHKILLSFNGAGQEKSILQAQMQRDWTTIQMAAAGLQWTENRGSYNCDPPEFTTRSSQDICADRDFRIFCTSARFVDGRGAVMPTGLTLRDTPAVLRYARLPKTLCPSRVGGLNQPERKPVPQLPIPANPALLCHDAMLFESSTLSYGTTPPARAGPQDLPQASSQHHQETDQIAIPVQNTMPLVHRIFHDVGVFVNLPLENLLRIQRQWLQARAQQYTSRGLPIPKTLPNALQMWHFFRQIVQTRVTTARRQQAAKETAASEEGQASTLRNSFAGQPGTPMSSRPLQLQSHMPRTPGSHGHLQINDSGNIVACATPLGSPFLTPGRVRNDKIDPRLA